jgi:hypothetical protein
MTTPQTARRMDLLLFHGAEIRGQVANCLEQVATPLVIDLALGIYILIRFIGPIFHFDIGILDIGFW